MCRLSLEPMVGSAGNGKGAAVAQVRRDRSVSSWPTMFCSPSPHLIRTGMKGNIPGRSCKSISESFHEESVKNSHVPRLNLWHVHLLGWGKIFKTIG